MDSNTNADLLHWLWTGVITAAGAIVAFFTKRLIDQVDCKAEQSDIDDLKETMNTFLERQDRQMERQEERHTENSRRLDAIIMRMSQR